MKNLIRNWRAERDDNGERGAFLILFAFLLVGMLIMSAIVIDLGHVRAARRGDQSVGDFRALAAGPQLAGAVVTGTGTVAGACQAPSTVSEPMRKTCLRWRPPTAPDCSPTAPVSPPRPQRTR